MSQSIRSPLRLRSQLVAITLVRVVVNTTHRMVYPFLPAFARGLGVELSALNLAVTSRAALGMAGPLFASASDRWGRKAGMVSAMAIYALGLAIVAAWPTYPALFTALLLTVLSKVIYDPSMQAYLGDRVPYSRRGLAIALTELGWSGAFLVGIPVLGFLIARSGWTAPFLPLAALGLIGLLVIQSAIPSDRPQHHPSLHRPNHLSALLRHPAALAALLTGLLISTANESVNIVYGVWMESAFALQVAAIGATTTVIGVSELAGEGLVGALVDRIGKRRALIGGLIASALACTALPFLTVNLTWALVGLFLFYVTFEFTVVASIPLMTELVPEARATVMAANMAGYSAGRVLGTLIGPLLFQYNFGWNGFAAALFNVVGAVLVVWYVKER